MNYPQQQSIYGSNQEKIDNYFVQLSLQKKTSSDWLDTPHSDKMLLSVTSPVYDNDNKVIGTLVLEQNNDTLLALQDQTFERILYLTLIVFLTITLLLFFISSRLLKRIINLRNDTNLALSNDGHISNQLYRNDNDEIGDLARSFSTLLSRIEQNNEYLRSLSGKLSHELRTPLTIIKSSLENMDAHALTKENRLFSALMSEERC
jgi:signal transduction histidine kinase